MPRNDHLPPESGWWLLEKQKRKFDQGGVHGDLNHVFSVLLRNKDKK